MAFCCVASALENEANRWTGHPWHVDIRLLYFYYIVSEGRGDPSERCGMRCPPDISSTIFRITANPHARLNAQRFFSSPC